MHCDGFGDNIMTRITQQSGYILLPVVLAITLVAVIAYLMSYESATETNIVGSELQADQAQYVAEAGLNHALWQIEQKSCGPYTDLTNQPLGSNSYSTTLTTNLGTTTAYNISVDQDTWIREDKKADTNATDTKLHIQYKKNKIERPMYRFDLSSIPANSPILSATAWFYVNKAHIEGPVNIHAITADWTDVNATWDSMGDNMDHAVLATIPAQPTGVWVSVNLTTQVQVWVNGQPNYGITLNSLSDDTHGEYASMESAEVPYLKVVVGDPPGSAAHLESVGTLTSGLTRTILQNDVVLWQKHQHDIQRPDATLGIDSEIWDQEPNNNYGDNKETWVSSASYDITRSLLRFNMSKIPVGAKILQATLSLYLISSSTWGEDHPVSAYRITNNWKEDEVSWNSRETGENWNIAGGDFDNTPVVTSLVGSTKQYYEWIITPLVQGWVDGRYENDGVLLAPKNDGMEGKEFYTSDIDNQLQRPNLSIIYTCACGVACVAPQGSGNILMVVDVLSSLTANEIYKQDLFIDWGYNVTLINDDENQATYDSALADHDVAYISDSVNTNVLGNKLSSTSKGVVNEKGRQNVYQGTSNNYGSGVGDSINIIDNSHYITAPFLTGVLPIYMAPMDQLTATGDLASGLQTLANVSGLPGLVLVDTGGVLADGITPAPGRRVMLPLGSENNTNFNWKYINNNGRLIIQRALQWGTGN